ncbi:MAG: PAS domain S-box protein [Candidatus Competibacteraceae bacterium]|nr:MAG: PAS domain S-box protein [Candidatus Competibacteraceae bacterium]
MTSKALVLALAYGLIAIFWVFGSNQLVLWLGLDAVATARLQTVKDWAFVGATTLLLFLLLRQLEFERCLASRRLDAFAPAPRAVWLPLALLAALVGGVLLLGVAAYREVALALAEEAGSAWHLLVWIGFVLLFALGAGIAGMLFWWQSIEARFELERLRAELESANLRRRYEALLQQSLDVVVLLAEDGAILEANDRVRDFYGYAPEELRGQHVSVLRAPGSRAAVDSEYRRVAQIGGALFEVWHQRRDGTTFPVEVSARALLDQDRRFFQSVVRDISERKQAEIELAERERRFRGTFEQAAVGIAHVAPDGRWLRVNDRLCAIVGYGRLEMLQKTFQDITHPDDLDKDRQLQEQILTGRIHTYSVEKRYLRKDGAIVWVDLTLSLMRDTHGRPEYFIAVVYDITDRKLAEQRLARVSRFHAALSLTNQAIFHGEDADGLFEEVCRIAVKCGELKGAWIGLLEPDSRRLRVTAAYGELRGRLLSVEEPIAAGAGLPYRPARLVLAGGAHWVGNDLRRDLGGENADWQPLVATAGVRSCAAFPLKRAGEVVGVFSLYASEPEFFDLELIRLLDQMAANVSLALEHFERERQRRLAEEAQARAERELRLAAAVYEQSAEGILISDADNHIIMVNRAFTTVTGYSLDEARGRNPNLLSSGRHERSFYQTMWAALEQKDRWQGEIWNRRKNGEIYPEWLGITVLRDPEGQIAHYVGIFNDIGTVETVQNRLGASVQR